ncbi:MAG TPA: orotidine-5'-phosphate decarboxylase [Acidobacteriota bacterium]|nr:orotidine-5'-phosphate decarboxylase [Acidobacteriota bacterium]
MDAPTETHMDFEAARQRLIVALDVSSRRDALRLADRLIEVVGCFKIGLQAFTSQGPALVKELTDRGGRVFLDLKMHDIPNTVAAGVEAAAGLGIEFLTIHTLGGPAMLKAARSGADRSGNARLKLLGVTVLTSLDASELASVGLPTDVRVLAPRLAKLAQSAGLDGIVCSPQDLAHLPKQDQGGFLRVTPGVRPAGAASQDQLRAATPEVAIRAGATHLVVGRPILQSHDPKEAAVQIVEAIRHARMEVK